MEYIGRRQGSECIKTIRVEQERCWKSLSINLLSFSPGGTCLLIISNRGVCVREANREKLVAGSLAGDVEIGTSSVTY